MSDDGRLPVLIVAGYLGAGKTTLLNDMLQRARTLGRRVAVLVNDFGTLAIDRDLIEAADDALIALDGGCVCCTFGADLAGTLATLGRRAPGIERIVIEASGVALPGPLAATIDLSLAHRTEAIIVVADAATLATRLADRYVGDTVQRQLAAADQVVLTKTEPLGADAIGDATRLVTATAPGCLVLAAGAGSAIRSAWIDTLLAEPSSQQAIAAAALDPPAPEGAYLGTVNRGRAAADHPFIVLAWQAQAEIDVDTLVALLERHRGVIIRAKGLLADRGIIGGELRATDREGDWCTLQGTGARITRAPFRGTPPRSGRSRLACFLLKAAGEPPPALLGELAALGLLPA